MDEIINKAFKRMENIYMKMQYDLFIFKNSNYILKFI